MSKDMIMLNGCQVFLNETPEDSFYLREDGKLDLVENNMYLLYDVRRLLYPGFMREFLNRDPRIQLMDLIDPQGRNPNLSNPLHKSIPLEFKREYMCEPVESKEPQDKQALELEAIRQQREWLKHRRRVFRGSPKGRIVSRARSLRRTLRRAARKTEAADMILGIDWADGPDRTAFVEVTLPEED